MNITPLDDVNDPRLADYLAFNDKALMKRKNACFIETERLIIRALDNGYQFESLVVVQEQRDHWQPLVEQHFQDIPLYLISKQMFKDLIKYNILTGILGIAKRKPPLTLDDLMANTTTEQSLRLLICEQIKEPANCGSIIRVATALGIDGIILGPHSADPYYRRTARVSMGTCYRMPIVKSFDLSADLKKLRDDYNVKLYATVLADDATPLHQIDPITAGGQHNRLAIMLGHEFLGLTQQAIQLAHQKIIIPMHLGADSLNISVSAAVFLYHFSPHTNPIRLPEAADPIIDFP